MPHFVYMLRCAKDRIYTGYTTDVAARYEKHRSGKGANFTRAFPPIEILKVFELNDKSAALSLEARIKHCTREQKEKFVKFPKGELPDIPKKRKGKSAAGSKAAIRSDLKCKEEDKTAKIKAPRSASAVNGETKGKEKTHLATRARKSKKK